MPKIELSFESGESSLEARSFSVKEGVSELFQISVVALSRRADIDLEPIVGRPASLRILSGVAHVTRWGRHWRGIVSHIEQVQPEVSDEGRSTYALTLVPELWLLTQRKGHRVYQHLSIPDIAERLLAEWQIQPLWAIDRGAYPKLEYKVQYGETDYAFLCRLLEEAGIAFHFPETEADGSRLLLGDHLTTGKPHDASPIRYVPEPNEAAQKEFVTEVQLAHGVRPGAVTYRDHEFRKPDYPLFGKALGGPAHEQRFEQYHYDPGAFLVLGGRTSSTPHADDKGIARHDETFGQGLAERALVAARTGKRTVTFRTNVFGLAPGTLITVDNHPHPSLASSESLLITGYQITGMVVGAWTMIGEAVFAKEPYRPPAVTPRPEAKGVEAALVVGPPGEEIHTDEHGRVRVQFPWDREGKHDDNSSCWIRVSQGWAGTGFGALNLPRVGQEVLVGFLSGNPDNPIVVGRVFNGKAPVPYKLPDHKTRSVWRSDSSPGGGGYNELLFEDAKSAELVYLQAQKDLRKLVKNDETLTVGHDRQSLVKNDLTETTLHDRTEVTGNRRTELTSGDRLTAVMGSAGHLVRGDEARETGGSQKVLVSGDRDLVIRGARREDVGQDSHLTVGGERREQVGQDLSLQAGGSLHAAAGQAVSIGAGGEIHVKSGAAVVIEAPDLTLHGSGGFIRIHPGGITISGILVDINSGGSPGSAQGGSPREPQQAQAAAVAAPEAPPTDDVSVTGLG
jgi:type VI secretion system secreted protein VgrG